MDWEKWCLRIGAGAVVFALAVRLIGGGAVQAVVEKLTQPEVASALLFMETGRILRPIPEEPLPETPEAPEAPENTVPVALPAFSPSDADLVKVHAVNGYDADLPALLAEPLSWKLKQTKPTVLIVHSHGSESYTKTEDYEEHSKYRTRNTDYNVVSIGAEIKRVLEAGGISVIHDTTCHDYPSYSKSYSNSRKSVKEYLAQYPSIEMVLDIHRDAIANKNGEQVHYVTATKSGTASRLMMVVGCLPNSKCLCSMIRVKGTSRSV